MPKRGDTQDIHSWDQFQQDLSTELEQSQRALKEISLMLEQNQLELNKLTQRNTTITINLQHVQAQLDSLPRSDIRAAYDQALDAQQRLLVMRGQLEKLQSDQSYLQRYSELLARTSRAIETTGSSQSRQSKAPSPSNAVKMLITAQEGERQRLSNQMHDGPAQSLSNFILQTEIALRLFEKDPARVKEELNALKKSANSTFSMVKAFIAELHPMMLADLGLAPTLKRYTDTYASQTGAEISLNFSGGDIRLESYLEVMVFRAIQELVNTSVRNGQATQVKVQLNIDDDEVRITVADNGKGFDADFITSPKGLGISLIKERVEMLGGTADIDSTPGHGARISLQIPSIVVNTPKS